MNKELIEKLKDKEQAVPFWMRREDEKEILRQAGRGNLLVTHYESWPSWKINVCDEPVRDSVYILAPGYEPDPEYIEIEIVTVGHFCRLRVPAPGSGARSLYAAAAHEDFVCFHDPFGKETTDAGDVPGWMRTLAAQDGDIKIHARFLKVNP